jgi:tRNA nucleotidyltransferase (CCA-adding enzyme)
VDIYLVGGAVRDEILGEKSKDLDYTVVLPPGSYADPFEFMAEELESRGYKIFVKTPQFATVRAQTPDRKETADFVLARKEGPYSDGRRPDWVKIGTLMDDLARRDFSMNAIAKDAFGGTFDFFGGRKDIDEGIIRTVGNPIDRFTEDALRAVRALRFSVTKNMEIAPDVAFAMVDDDVLDAIQNKISDERIDIELKKMFAGGTTLECIRALSQFPALTYAMTAGGVSLTSTMKQIKKG